MPLKITERSFTAGASAGDVSAILMIPPRATCLLVFAHGAGAGMRHRTMDALAEDLAPRRIATFRFNFPYMEKGNRVPSPQPILLATVRAAVTAAAKAAPRLPLLAGGKSMGGRMTSIAAAMEPLAGVRGLVFFGFPLHAPGKHSAERGAHLAQTKLPMLFLQGARDNLADLELMRPLCRDLGSAATLEILDHADHSFHVLKRSGRTDAEVLDQVGRAVATWAAAILDS